MKRLLYASGYYHHYGKSEKIQSLCVLCYHGLTVKNSSEISNIPNAFLHIPVKEFEKQMRFIRGVFNPISLSQLRDAIKDKTNLPERSVLITFDDGYKSIYRLAKPVLQKYSITPVIFVATQNIGTNQLMWPDRLFWYFQQLDEKFIEMPTGYPVKRISWKSQIEKNNIAYELIQWLKSLENEQRKTSLEKITKENGYKKYPPVDCLVLDEKEIFKLSALGFDIGSHASTHPILSKMSRTEQEQEIVDSKTILESITNKPLASFAYPEGKISDFNDDTIDLLKKHGYTTAFTTVEGYNSINDDQFRLKRIFVLGNLPIWEFCHRMVVSWPSNYRHRSLKTENEIERSFSRL